MHAHRHRRARAVRPRRPASAAICSGLLHEWAADDAARRHEFVLYAPEPLGRRPSTRAVSPTRHRRRAAPAPGGSRCGCRAAAARDHLDVFFAPGLHRAAAARASRSSSRFTTCRSPRIPSGSGCAKGIRRRWLTRQSARRRARAVVTISEFSRRELIERLGVAESRIHVIPPGIDRPPATSRAPDRATGRSVLYVGSIFNRRHVPDLIRAFAHRRARAPGGVARYRRRQSHAIRARICDDAIAREGLERPRRAGGGTSPTTSSARCTAARARSRFCPSTKGWA